MLKSPLSQSLLQAKHSWHDQFYEPLNNLATLPRARSFDDKMLLCVRWSEREWEWERETERERERDGYEYFEVRHSLMPHRLKYGFEVQPTRHGCWFGSTLHSLDPYEPSFGQWTSRALEPDSIYDVTNCMRCLVASPHPPFSPSLSLSLYLSLGWCNQRYR